MAQGFGQCHLHFLYKVIVIVRIVFGCVFETFYSGEDLKHGGAIDWEEHICVHNLVLHHAKAYSMKK